MTPNDIRREVITDLGRFSHDPYGFVLWCWSWEAEGTQFAADVGPDTWQREQLMAIGERLRTDPHKPILDSTASGHGIGKSALIAWILLWGLLTREDTRIVITANTENQLRTKTWPELSKWYSAMQFDCLREMFVLEGTALRSTEPGHERTWRCDAVAWSKANPEAFAGLHNSGKRIVILYDEASSIDDRIWDTSNGAATDAGTEIIWLAYGNPTKNTGRFYETIAGKFRSQWTHRQIDSRDVARTNKEYLNELIKVYGEDSDAVRVRILGKFPRSGSNQLISTEIVQAARKREAPQMLSEPVIFGVDCARFGDDHSTLAIRRGRDARSMPWKKWANTDAMTLSGDIAIEARKWRPAAIFVDAGNIGAAVIDRLRQLLQGTNILIVEVWFAGRARDATWAGDVRVKCVNKRSEMWVSMRAWLAWAAIPDDDDLESDLTAPEYFYGPDQVSVQLERKEDMKKRGLSSPDDGDALALTFAEFVAPMENHSIFNPPDLSGDWGTPKAFDRYSELP